MKMNNFEFNNQNLQEFLTKNEASMKTGDFFSFLENAQVDDPQNFQIRPLWVSDGDWTGEYKVVFGAHFNLRAWQRLLRVAEPIEAVMKQLSNNKVAEAVTSYHVYWDNKHKQVVGSSETVAVAVIQEGMSFVPVYAAGDSFVNVKTVIAKEPDMYFSRDTAILAVDKAGNVSWVREPKD